MARKQDSKGKAERAAEKPKAKGVAARSPKGARDKVSAKTSGKSAGKNPGKNSGKAAAKTSDRTAAKRAKAPSAAAALELVSAPLAATSTGAKRAVKAAKGRARKLVPDAGAAMSGQVGDTVRTIGNQIVGALNTDVGRVMVAELLIYVAKSLTKAAASTETAEDAKTAILNAGAKIGAAAADAGARMMETGGAAAAKGAELLDEGRSAAGAGIEAASGSAGQAKDLVREVAQAAVGAVGGMVVDAAQKVTKGRRKAEPAKVPFADTEPGPHRQL